MGPVQMACGLSGKERVNGEEGKREKKMFPNLTSLKSQLIHSSALVTPEFGGRPLQKGNAGGCIRQNN